MFDPASYERWLTANAVIEQLDAGSTRDFGNDSVAALTDLLNDPWALNEVGDEKPYAAGLVWRLGVANNMSRVVLANVADLGTSDPELLQSTGFTQGYTIARGLLHANPRLLEGINERDADAFWGLVRYDPVETDESVPSGILSILEVLQDAAYIPETIIAQMRHHRDTSSTMRHEPQIKNMAATGESFDFDIHEPDGRERELTEATVRTTLGAFVTRYTGEDSDHRIAITAVRDFAARALTDASGMGSALALMATLDSIGVSGHQRTSDLVEVLRERITGFAPQVELTDVPLDELTYLAEAVHAFARQTPSPAIEGLLTRIASNLEAHESFYGIGGDPHLTNPVVSDPRTMLQVSQAYSAREGLSRALGLLRGETASPSVITPETVINGLAANGFSVQLMHAAFKLVGAELDQGRKARLEADFDTAINAALENLGPNHPLSSPNALSELRGNTDLGILARFPSGRRFIAERTQAYAELVNRHLQQPEVWLNQQQHPDFVAACWADDLYDALSYNRAYFGEAGEEGIDTIAAAQAAILGVMSFIDLPNAQPGTLRILAKSSEGLVALLDEARTALHRNLVLGRPLPQVTGSPLSQLLNYYRQPLINKTS